MNALALAPAGRQLGRFVVVGVANTCLGLALIYTCAGVFGLGPVASNFIGYAVAVLVGFGLNRQWTFEHRGPGAPALGRYLLVLALAYLANLAVVVFAIDVLRVHSGWAQALGVIPYAVTGYLGSRYFAFRNPMQ